MGPTQQTHFLLCKRYTSYTIHLYYYTGATQYISIATCTLYSSYTIHIYCYAGATPYIYLYTGAILYIYTGATPYVTGFGKTLRMGFLVKIEFDVFLISSTIELTICQV